MQDHTVNLVRGLAEAGHEVEVVCPLHPDGLTSAEYEGARWHFVDAVPQRARLPMRNPLWLERSADLFSTLQAERAFDLVHSESTSGLGLLRRRWHERLPIVVKFHGNYLTFARAGLRRLVGGNEVVREAKGLIWNTGQTLTRGNWYAFRACEAMVPSRAQRRGTIRSHLLRSSRVHVVPNGIDADAFAPGDRKTARAEVGLPDGMVFVVLGRLYPGKGVDVAIRALAQVDADASLVVVGDGESRGELEELARDVEAGERVRFVGVQPRERMPAYLRGADALVFPTLLPEAAPLTPLQAMAAGVPVLASRLGAIPELLDRPGVNGLLVQAGDVAQLARGMEALARDPSLRGRLGAAGRERVLAEYTLGRMIERTLDVYEVARARFARGR